ncbi:MAG: hypothetical protein JWQ22_1910 [Devosia sp.]|nr:hypothetical protein [Devosia sp.]
MRVSAISMLASVLLATTIIPVYSQDVLGGLLGGGDLDSVVTIQSGPASDSGAVNVGLGGGGGNVVDANIGGSSAPVANANVSTGGGALGVNAGVLNDSATANVRVVTF